MRLKLDEYQVTALKETYTTAIKQGPGSGTMLQMATGTGKTEVGIGLLKIHNRKLPNRVHCWLTHREELREQSSNRLSASGLPVIVMNDVAPKDRRWYKNAVNVVSPQMRSWPALPQRPGLLIIDEAHHTPATTWARFIEAWQHMGGIVIGLTATPWRLDKKQGFTKWYQNMIHGPTIEWLQDNNYLAAPQVIAPHEALLSDHNAKVMSTGDYEYNWMESEVLMLLAHSPVIKHWEKATADMEDKRTMWFVPTVKCAYELAKPLGQKSKVLIGDTPSHKRKAYLEMLRQGVITHLISVDVLGEGLDIPSVPIIATLRPTKSIVVWKQQCGRAARPKGERGVYGGNYLVLDYANNVNRHGTPDEEYPWSLEPREKTDQKRGNAVIASCYNVDTCRDAMLHPANRECWNCGSPQYFKCEACHVDRRWTRFTKSKGETCDVCIEAKEFEERAKRQEEYYTANQRLRVKINAFKPGQKPKTPTEKIQAFSRIPKHPFDMR